MKTETFRDVVLSDKLSAKDADRIKSLLHELSEVFSDKPRVANAEPHKIILTSRKPRKVKPRLMKLMNVLVYLKKKDKRKGRDESVPCYCHRRCPILVPGSESVLFQS